MIYEQLSANIVQTDIDHSSVILIFLNNIDYHIKYEAKVFCTFDIEIFLITLFMNSGNIGKIKITYL